MTSAMELESSLRKSGWHLKAPFISDILQHFDHTASSSMTDEQQKQQLQALVISELLNLDLTEVGAPFLPDRPTLEKFERLNGPLVLQVVAVRNILEGSARSLVIGQQRRRLLRINLTDGHMKITAIEYHPIPALSLNTAPGTKVRLENASLHSGILLGDAKSFTILGGHVEALYQNWEIERKYLELMRMTLKTVRADGDVGPPPFHGLLMAKQDFHHGHEIAKDGAAASDGKFTGRKIKTQAFLQDKTVESSIAKPLVKSSGLMEKERSDAIKAAKASGMDAAPLQNREAAQKLLEKRIEMQRGQRSTGGRGRGRTCRDGEMNTMTLEEWESRKGAYRTSENQLAETNDDAVLAQRLHYQLNVATSQAESGLSSAEAEQIRLSMFNFGGDASKNDEHSGGRRGKGRGRGGRRGRGRR